MGEFFDQAHFQVARTAAQPCQHRVDLGCLRQQERLVLEQDAKRAAGRSASSSTCIWPIISGGVVWAVKPPPARASLAIKEAPATTDGSSIAIGTSTLAAVDQEVQGDAQRQSVHADHVLDHVVGLFGAQPGIAAQGTPGLPGARRSASRSRRSSRGRL